ncbi:twin-arginine translocation signal domain-containing protein [Desulfococcaceae bacterium HSG7]|nr:twin-arginine translocation signal domain-containing protein [Desulfococcaceae bacterium HSG7]
MSENKVTKTVSRRSFLARSAGTLTTGAAMIGGGSFVHEIIQSPKAHASAGQNYPYTHLYEYSLPDLAELGRLNMVAGGGCGLNGAKTMVDALIQAFPDSSWSSFPVELFSYGGGGANGWGTLCGALNGTLAIMSLICQHNDFNFPLIADALMK